jgi:hypothetical protein
MCIYGQYIKSRNIEKVNVVEFLFLSDKCIPLNTWKLFFGTSLVCYAHLTVTLTLSPSYFAHPCLGGCGTFSFLIRILFFKWVRMLSQYLICKKLIWNGIFSITIATRDVNWNVAFPTPTVKCIFELQTLTLNSYLAQKIIVYNTIEYLIFIIFICLNYPTTLYM